MLQRYLFYTKVRTRQEKTEIIYTLQHDNAKELNYEICIFTFVTLLLACGSVLANGPLLQKLQQIKEISGIRELKVQPYTEYYEFWYEQPIDHNNPSKGTFKQRVLLGHRDFNAPMVAILEGYGIYSPAESELSKLFKTNQLTIEHRFSITANPKEKHRGET